MKPSLCVLIPVFNNQAGLARTLLSLAAAPGPMDVIVVDDGSHPPMRTEPDMAGPHHVILRRLELNGGITRALNHGLQLAYDGDYRYIGRVDAGDTVRPDRFEKQLRRMEQNPACGLVGSLIDFVDLNGVSLFVFRAPEMHGRIVKRMQVENCIIHSGATMRAETVRKVGGYRGACLASEDYDLFQRMIRVSEATVIPETLTSCEYNLAGLSISRRGRQQWERLKLQFRYFRADDWMSYYGVARTCLAMVTPHKLVLGLKRAGQCSGEARVEGPVIS
jgi:GT2 family glycosyltransferase